MLEISFTKEEIFCSRNPVIDHPQTEKTFYFLAACNQFSGLIHSEYIKFSYKFLECIGIRIWSLQTFLLSVCLCHSPINLPLDFCCLDKFLSKSRSFTIPSHNNAATLMKSTRADSSGLHGNGLSFHHFAKNLRRQYLVDWRGAFSSYFSMLYKSGVTDTLLHKKMLTCLKGFLHYLCGC